MKENTIKHLYRALQSSTNIAERHSMTSSWLKTSPFGSSRSSVQPMVRSGPSSLATEAVGNTSPKPTVVRVSTAHHLGIPGLSSKWAKWAGSQSSWKSSTNQTLTEKPWKKQSNNQGQRQRSNCSCHIYSYLSFGSVPVIFGIYLLQAQWNPPCLGDWRLFKVKDRRPRASEDFTLSHWDVDQEEGSELKINLSSV